MKNDVFSRIKIPLTKPKNGFNLRFLVLKVRKAQPLLRRNPQGTSFPETTAKKMIRKCSFSKRRSFISSIWQQIFHL